MAAAQFRSVDEYIGAQAASSRATLECVRAAIRGALPEADETIAYNMPTYKWRGRAVIHFAAWKHHYSLYPASAKLLRFFKKDLVSATINKSTIRFPLDEPVPVALLTRIAKFRVEEQAERAAAKKARA
jgi:uncharacterized protein YdhG (YjbR/CyaY superfamily)